MGTGNAVGVSLGGGGGDQGVAVAIIEVGRAVGGGNSEQAAAGGVGNGGLQLEVEGVDAAVVGDDSRIGD